MNTLAKIWNESIEKNQKPIEPRERIWASELGGSMIDRFHKLKGTAYTNPPNSRSMRKFLAGDVWEWIVKTVLVKSGIPFRTQERIELNYDGLLPITGRIDFIIGGEKREVVRLEELPEFMIEPAKNLFNSINSSIEEKVLEIKSVSSHIFEKILETNNPLEHHLLQASVYYLSKKIPTDIVYVCRDDCRLAQFNIDEVAEAIEQKIKKDVETLTYYYKNDIEPPKEELIIWNGTKFETNWRVQYSNYLSKFYSYEVDGKAKPIETPDEYSDEFASKVSSWNRVVKRLREGAKLTTSNQQYIEEMNKFGFGEIIKNITKQ